MTESPQRTAFSHFHPILTRPSDNDVNGHIAGATVHGFFETAIQAFLVEQAEVDLRDGELAAFVVSSAADFFALPGFPDVLEVRWSTAWRCSARASRRRVRQVRWFRCSSNGPVAVLWCCLSRCK